MNHGPINELPAGGLLDMVQRLVPGYSGKGVDDGVAQQMQQAGIGQLPQGEIENPKEEAAEGGIEEPLAPQQASGLLQMLQQLLANQQQA